jgi:uncharacterized damage-inducible protein DinB
MDRGRLRKLWEEGLDDGLWYAPWSKAIDGLTAAEAAWKPAEGRHSIWQLVNHIVFWQDYTLRAARGQKPTREEFAKETERRNWEEPAETTEAAWKDARDRFMTSYRAMLDLVEMPEASERPLYHLLHESYHFGQIMYLRAMQGRAPIE